MSLGFARRYTAGPVATRGFTILEMVITVVLAVLLVALALPSFRELTLRTNVTSLTNSLVITLNSARSEAVRRGTLVEVVPLTSGSWTGGWKVMADTAFDRTFATQIGQQQAAPTGYKVCPAAQNATAPGSALSVIFDQTGALRFATSADVNIVRPDTKTAQYRWISVGASGEVRSQMYTSSSNAPTTCS